jgi:hypothetical protein
MDFIYSFLSEGMDKRPAYSFSHRLRAAVQKPNTNPSPMDYFLEKTPVKKSRGCTFGHRSRLNFVKDYDTPGPGEYFIGEEIPVPRPPNISGYSFGKRPKMRPKSHSPGPGKYMPDVGGNYYPPKGFSFGGRSHYGRRISGASITPGPGESSLKKLYFI